MSKIRPFTEDAFCHAVATNESIAGVMRQLGLTISGGGYHTVRTLVKRLGLDTSHWTGSGYLKGKKNSWTKALALSEILVQGRPVNGAKLKQRLFKAGLLENRCSECGISTWRGRTLVLQIDHINGAHDDNRLENLRILCPNCHSQTPTWGTGNRQYRAEKPTRVCACGTPICREATRCRKCAAIARRDTPDPKKPRRTKISWPSPEDLSARIATSSFSAVAFDLGIGTSALRKHLKIHLVP